MKRGRPSIWALAQNSLEQEARKHNRSRRTFTRYLRVLAYGVPELVELVKLRKLKISAAEVIARRLTPDQQRMVISRGVPAIVRVAGLTRRGIRETPIARERQIFRIAEFLVTRLGRHGVREFAGQVRGFIDPDVIAVALEFANQKPALPSPCRRWPADSPSAD